MTQAEMDIKRKLKVLNYAKEKGNVAKACRYFGLSREMFYRWKMAYETCGEEALVNSKPCPQNLKLRTPKAIEGKVIYLRKTYHLGPQKKQLKPPAPQYQAAHHIDPSALRKAGFWPSHTDGR